MIDITWYGRGGQGAFTASRVLGAAAMLSGYKSLSFPSFGPERRGAPIRAFTKISNKEISDRSIPPKSDYILVLDDSLYDPILKESLKEGGILIVNTQDNTLGQKEKRVVTKDISSLALQVLGRPIVNIGVIGVLTSYFKDIKDEYLFDAIREYMPEKIVEKNIELLNRVISKSRI